MKTLLLVRHAKSDWSNQQLPDHERPLNGRGRRNAPAVAQYLNSNNFIPELILSSTAKRAHQTSVLMRKHFEPQPLLILNESLYHAGYGEVQESISILSPELNTVMLVGHNPGWEATASHLCGERLSMTTANVVVLRHTASDWSGIFEPGSWDLIEHIQPKKI